MLSASSQKLSRPPSTYNLRNERKRTLRLIELDEGGTSRTSVSSCGRSLGKRRRYPERSRKATIKKVEAQGLGLEGLSDESEGIAEHLTLSDPQEAVQVAQSSEATHKEEAEATKKLQHDLAVLKRWFIAVHLKRLLHKNISSYDVRPEMPLIIRHQLPEEALKVVFGGVDVTISGAAQLEVQFPREVLVREFSGNCWAEIVPPMFVGKKSLAYNVAYYLQNGEQLC